MPRRAILILVMGWISPVVSAADLFDGFAAGWRERWHMESFFGKATRYEVTQDDGRPVLHAHSSAAHGGLVRAHPVPAPTAVRLTWRWKISAPLTGNTRERERAGDDYVARVFVVFETSMIPLRTRAINYVWAAQEPAGAVFPSPYTKNVAMIVVRSGAAESGAWQSETRDVLADYRAFFGTAPSRVSAVAVMSDTDNTGGSAEAWFSDLVLATESTP